MNENYYIYVDQQYGPFNGDTMGHLLREGRLTKDSWVFFEGETPGWTRAVEVKSLSKLFQASAHAAAVASAADETMGTMIVSPTKQSGVKKIESVLPVAPLSDIPQHTGQTIVQRAQQKPIGTETWWGTFGRFFRRK